MIVNKADYMVATTGNKRLDRFFGFEGALSALEVPMCHGCFGQVIDECYGRRKRLKRPMTWAAYKYHRKLTEEERPDCRTCIEDGHVKRCVDNKIFVSFEAFNRRETDRMISNFGIILQEIEKVKVEDGKAIDLPKLLERIRRLEKLVVQDKDQRAFVLINELRERILTMELRQKGETIAEGTLKRILDKLDGLEERVSKLEKRKGRKK